MLRYGGIHHSSTVDYPGKACAVVYLHGCPFRCGWCHNPELVVSDEYQEDSVDHIVDKLKGNFLISAVSITGGEPLMQDETIELLKAIKTRTKLSLKIDTNCYFPEMLEKALPFLDMISLDIKANLEDYEKAVGVNIDRSRLLKSFNILKNWSKPKEVRTTVVQGMNDNSDDIDYIAHTASEIGASFLTLQSFRPGRTIDPTFSEKTSVPHDKMVKLGKIAKKHLPNAKVTIVTPEKGIETITLS